ncbi:MAG TPA: serine/threonine-protein kinase [Gemmataceae bacterium]
MPSPDTITGAPDSDRGRVPSTAGWEEAADNPHFSVSPIAPALLADLGSAALHRATITGAATPLEGSAETQLPTINGYRILGILGRGGMGTVYKALHLELNKTVALKIVHPGRADSTLRARFEREFRSLAAIEHPNIVPVYDAGAWQGFSYFTMRYVADGALSAHLSRFRADPEAGCKLMVKVARAVQHLHESGVLHRDLKPLNILIGEGDEPLVADFGLAKWIDDDSDMTVTGLPMGTRQYMSPEQTLGSKSEYTAACDVWALGIVLYEVFAGHRPFGSEDPVELYTQIRSADPPAMADFNPAAPAPLEAIARRCLAKDPRERYASAADLAADLERWLAGDATTATHWPRKGKSKRSWRPWLAALAATIAGIAVIAAIASRKQAEPLPKTAEVQKKPAVRTVAERLLAGETVTLLGEKGFPPEAFSVIPGSSGAPILGPDNAMALASPGFLGIELVSEPLPVPVRFEVEYALTTANETWSWAGMFAGRKLTLEPQGPIATGLRVIQQNSHAAINATEETATEKVGAELFLENRPGPLDGRIDLGSKTKSAVMPIQRKPVPTWYKLAADVTPFAMTASWNGEPFKPLTADRAAKLFAGLFLRELKARNIELPAFGPGLGLEVRNAEAWFRNARLVPLKP